MLVHAKLLYYFYEGGDMQMNAADAEVFYNEIKREFLNNI